MIYENIFMSYPFLQINSKYIIWKVDTSNSKKHNLLQYYLFNV